MSLSLEEYTKFKEEVCFLELEIKLEEDQEQKEILKQKLKELLEYIESQTDIND